MIPTLYTGTVLDYLFIHITWPDYVFRAVLVLFDNQVQEIYHGLVTFCSELKKMEGEIDVDQLDSLELKKRLSQAQNNLQSKRQSLQILKDNLNTGPVQKIKYDLFPMAHQLWCVCQ